jgi:hypothetical protein
MKLNKSYLINRKEEISNTIYCKCLSDCQFQDPKLLNVTHCYKSFIYKFTKDKNLIYEIRLIDFNNEYIYEEKQIQLNDEEFANFSIIGNIADLMNYLEKE